MFSTRGLVVVAALMLALAPGLFPWLSRADAWSYGQVANLKPGVPAARMVLSAVPVSADGRSDSFSLGVILYRLLTGQAPFRGENLAGIAYQITTAKPDAVRTLRPELPAAVGRIVSRALQNSPDKRYQTAGEMAEALRKAASRARRAEETASHG